MRMERKLGMRGNAWKKSLDFCAAIVLLVACAGGCVELKYSAQNRLSDPVSIRSSRAIRSVYFSFLDARPQDKQYCEFFTAGFTTALEKKGFVAAGTASNADIVIKAKAAFYKKAQGTFLFVLIVPTYRFNEEYDGISMKIAFQTDKGRWNKRYRAYYRGWLDGDIEIASDSITQAIIEDISLPPHKGREKSE
jgi:hypothetical protein